MVYVKYKFLQSLKLVSSINKNQRLNYTMFGAHKGQHIFQFWNIMKANIPTNWAWMQKSLDMDNSMSINSWSLKKLHTKT